MQQDFIARKEQNLNMAMILKKNPPKLVLNKLKVIGNFTLIHTYWAQLKKKTKNMCFMFTHVWPMCTHVQTTSELKFN